MCEREISFAPLFFLHIEIVGLPFMVPCKRINQWKLVVIRQTCTHAEVKRSEKKKWHECEWWIKSGIWFSFYRACLRMCGSKNICFSVYINDGSILSSVRCGREWESGKKANTRNRWVDYSFMSWTSKGKNRFDWEKVAGRYVCWLFGHWRTENSLTNELWQVTDSILNATDKIRIRPNWICQKS